MTREAHLPDGTVLEFPDNTPDAVMDKTVKAHLSGGAPQDSAGRQIGLGVRSALEGVASIPDFVGTPAYGAYRAATGKQPVTFTGLADAASDKMGLPTPATPTERVISDISRAGTGTATTLGAGAALGPLSKVGQFMSANPVQQAVGSMTGSAAGGLSRENGQSRGA